MKVIIVVLLKIDPTPNEFVEAAVIYTTVIVIDSVRAVI